MRYSNYFIPTLKDDPSDAEVVSHKLMIRAGMIKIFNVIAEKPIVNPPELAGGISEALYTTAFGLVVAIPAFIAYKFIIGKTDELIFLMEEEGRKIMEYVIIGKENDTKS